MALRRIVKTPELYSEATYEPVDYAGDAAPMGTVLGWILHVVVGLGDPWLTFENAVAPDRRFSHLWFARDGHVEQYQRLSEDSWAQVAGNGSYWSAETEGMPTEPLTDAQLDALAAWHVWSGTVDQLAQAPGQRGIGTHQMGGAAWGGHACPGAIRAGQRPEILRRAVLLRQGGAVPVDLTPAAEMAVANQVLAGRPDGGPYEIHDPANPTHLLVLTDALSQVLARLAALQADVTALRAAVALQPKP